MPTNCYECGSLLTGPVCGPCNETDKDRRVAEYAVALMQAARELLGKIDIVDVPHELAEPHRLATITLANALHDFRKNRDTSAG